MSTADFVVDASVLVFVRATLILCVAVTAASVMQRGATRRSAVWSGAAICLLMLPILAIVLPPRFVSMPEGIVEQFIVHSPEITASRRSTPPLQLWPMVCVAVWLLGALALLTRLLLAIGASRRLVASSWRTDNARILDVLAATSRSARLRKVPRVALSDAITVPMTAGVFDPFVLLPAHATTWTRERLEAVLRHEIAHVARRDYVPRLAFEVVSAIYWPNPLVWYAAARARIDQERVADDFVIEGGVSPHDYASLLVELARSAGTTPPSAPALAVTTPPLKTRVASILDGRRRERTLNSGAAGVVALLGVTLTPAIATISLTVTSRLVVALPVQVTAVRPTRPFFGAAKDSLLNAVYYGDRPSDRLAAARVLRKTRRNDSAALFLAHLADTCSSDRWRAARALRELADVRALDPLVATMRADRSEAVRNMAADAVDVLRYVRLRSTQ